MHFILGLLGGLVTIAILLKRLDDAGISLGGLNPFQWKRRRDWRNQHTANPIFNVESPMAASALLLTAAAKIDGDISRDQKNFLLSVFKNDFHQSEKDAAGLLTSSTYLLGDGQAIQNSLEQVLKPSLSNFNQMQAESTTRLLQRLCELDATPSELRNAFSSEVQQQLNEPFKKPQDWS